MKSPVERSGFLLTPVGYAQREQNGASGTSARFRQGIAVIGRSSRITLVTSVQELLDRMKRKKFSMRRLPFLFVT